MSAGAACNATEPCGAVLLLCTTAVGNASAAAAGVCTYKPLFAPFLWQDALATATALLSVALSSGAGLGGGGLMVPLFVLIYGSTALAIPLSKASIFGGAIANLVVNARQRHPRADRPLIDAAVAVLLEPTTLAGAVFGVLVNDVLPSYVITALLILFLGAIAVRTLRRGVQQLRAERAERAAEQETSKPAAAEATSGGGGGSDHSAAETDALLGHRTHAKPTRRADGYARVRATAEIDGDGDGDSGNDADADADGGARDHADGNGDAAFDNASAADGVRDDRAQAFGATAPISAPLSVNADADAALDADEERQRASIALRESRWRWPYVLVLVVLWLAMSTLALARGGHGTASLLGVQCGGAAYWATVAAVVPVCVLPLVVVGVVENRVHRAKMRLGVPLERGDIAWTGRVTAGLASASVGAGFAAGMLGIGGGMVQAPLLLEMGVLPEVATATAAFMVLFTSSSVVVQFVVMRRLPVDYAGWFAVLGLLSSFFGQFVVRRLLRRFRSTSILVLLLGVILGLSTLLMGGVGIATAVVSGGEGFHSLCGS